MEPNNNAAAENAEQVPAPAPDAQPEQDAVVEAPAAIPESRLPTKKDTSLREFLGKMDDYAPIVRCPSYTLHPTQPPPLPFLFATTLTSRLDPRRGNPLLHDQSRPPAPAADRPPPSPPPRPRDPKVHRGRLGRRVPVQPDPRVQHGEQPDGEPGRRGGVPDPGPAGGRGRAAGEGPGEGRLAAGDPEGWVWRRGERGER